MKPLKDIEESAAQLLAKRDSGDWTERDQAQLTAWMQESTAHRIAVLRLEAAWEFAARLKAVTAGLPPETVPPPGEWRQTPFFDREGARERRVVPDAAPPPPRFGGSASSQSSRRRRRYFAASLAASLLLVLIGTGTWYLWPMGDRYSTPVGGMASVALQDGSHVTLNTASKILVAILPSERRIELEQGEAFFEVAKDPARPFVVDVGNKRVVAVGTKFSVSREDDEVRVVVTEGTVRLEDVRLQSDDKTRAGPKQAGGKENAGTAWPRLDPAAIPLTAGTVARATDDDVLVQKGSIPQAEEALSWRQGYLTFHETALADAVADFNRYNTQKIVIVDPLVAGIRISGTFRPTNSEAFLRLLHDGFSLHARIADGKTALSKD